MCFASPVGTCITRFIKRSHFQLLALYDSHTLSTLATMFSQAQSVHTSRDLSHAVTFSYLLSMIRIPCRHLHLKVVQAQSVHASKIFSQAHAVGTCISRISNAVTLYLHLFDSHTLCMFRIPCWYCIYINTRLSYQPSHLHLYDRKL